MSPTLPIEGDYPAGDPYDDFKQSEYGNGPPPPPIITDNSDSDEDEPIVLLIIQNNEIVYQLPDAINPLIEDNGINAGYELLPQDPIISPEEALVCEGEGEDDENVEAFEEIASSVCDIPVDSNIPKETMEPDHIEKIKHVMKSVQLPECNIPEWSQHIPEEKWKNVLMEKLHIKPDSQSSNSNTSSSSVSQVDKPVEEQNLPKDSCSALEYQVMDATSFGSSSVPENEPSVSPVIKNCSSMPSAELPHSPSNNYPDDTGGD